MARREALYARLIGDFPDPVSVAQINWEREDSVWIAFKRRGMARIEKFLSDWPTGDFAFFSSWQKIVMIFLMWLGRLEFFAVLALLHPRFWTR